jgi:superoxide reductase
MNELYQTADWKAEKHVPVIDAPASAKKDEPTKVTVTVGKEIAHPNTTEHYIAWIEVYFHPEGAKFPHFLGKFDFGAHGGSPDGPNTSTIYTEPKVELTMKTGKAGTIHAASYCNIHGLWTSSVKLGVE